MTMSTSHVRAFDSTLQTTHEWLRELEAVATLRDQAEAYSVLRAVLHALRDRLPADEAVDLGAQLPMLIRGFYYESWKPSTTPTKQRTLEAFLETIQPRLNPKVKIGAEEAVRSVFKVLSHRISEGEIADIVHVLPSELRTLWPAL
jgi:uncharacterized protein (DUF2267 family)